MTEREQKILEAVHEILHGGYSIDCEEDQEYVCELIDEAVSEIINEDITM